ncbi:hypothetical protein L596_030024 [Steinernema carpocapsae]|uniref:Phosphoglycerate kinase n=1 Tax=Steinernema carpocapsae TaxID=34508 RepID=A0A4U5LRI8_STECR|nr:hypothetical protein L596_030024 [Steinernema carpocapsae]
MTLKKLTIDNVPFSGKRILLRAHLAGAKSVVIVSHIDRPLGKRVERLSLRKVLPILERCLDREITFLDDCIGPEIEAFTSNPPNGSVFLLESVRFHPEEERIGCSEDQIASFEASLRSHGDIYVNDAFGTSHRSHVSLMGLGMQIRAAGLLMKKELDYIAKAIESPKRPYVAISGGAKGAEKMLQLPNLIDFVDEIVVGGGMASIFLNMVHKMPIGDTIHDAESAKLVPGLLEKAKAKGVHFHLPVDLVIAQERSNTAETRIVEVSEGVPDGWMMLVRSSNDPTVQGRHQEGKDDRMERPSWDV